MINIGALIATLKLDDNLTPALAKAQASLKRVGSRLKKTGAAMRATGTSMTMGLTAPIVAGVGAVAFAFGSFEKSMNRVKALSGATGQEFEAMTAQAKELGKTTSFSASEAADAMGFLAMAGFETTEIMGAMPGVLELAAAAQMDLASAADITSNIMTGYGQTTKDLAKTNNILVQAMTSANVDLRMLGESMKYVGPVAKSAGVSFEEATASIALMGNAGIQGSMAGTALRGAISKLLNPTSKAAKEMRTLGLNALDAEGNLRPMSDIVQQLGDRGATTGQMMTIFGLRAGPAMAGLVSQGHQALRKMTGELEGVGNVAQRIKDIQLEGLSGAFVRFKSAANGAMIEMGEKLAPVLEAFLEKAIQIANWISDTLVPAFAALSPTTQKWIIGLAAAAAAAGPFLIVLGALFTAVGTVSGGLAALVPVLAPLLPLFGFVAGGFSAAALAASPLLPILALLVAGFALFKFVKWAKEAQIFGRAIDKVKNILGFMSDAEYEAAKASRQLNEDLGDVTPTAEALREVLGVAGVEGTVAELQQAMVNLAGVAGGLAEDEMDLIAQRSIQLRDAGEDLTPELERIVTQFERTQVAADDAADALETNQEATEDLADSVISLRDQLSGANLLRDVEDLEAAWEALTPEQQANERTMREAGEMAAQLREEIGPDALSGDLIGLADAADAASVSVKDTGTAMSDTAVKAARLADEFSGKNLRKEVDALEMSLGNLIFMEEDSKDALLQVGEAALKLREQGAALNPELDRLADHFVNVESAANDFVGPIQEAVPEMGAFRGVLNGVADDMSGVFMAAFEGGGNALGAIKSMATKAVGGLLNMIPVVGPFLSKFAGPLVSGIGKITGALKGLFTRDTAENLKLTAKRMWNIGLNKTAAKAAADMAAQMEDDFAGLIMSLGTIVEEGGGVMSLGFENVTRAARDTFSAIDQGKIDTDQALVALTPVLKELAANFDQAGVKGKESFLELLSLASEFGLDMDAIVSVVGQDLVDKALGQDLPTVVAGMRDSLVDLKQEGLEPFIARLVALGVITNDDLTAINELMHGSQVDFKAMEEAAHKYGIELSALGPKFDEARLNDIATNIVADFELLTQNGADVNAVIAGMGDEVQALVTDAQNAGQAIPDNMRPIIEQMIEMGTLVGANGEAITDMSDVNFAEPMAEKFDKVVDKLDVMITKFLDLLGLTDDVTTSVNNIPTAVRLDVGFNVERMPAFEMPDVNWDWGSVDMNWGDLDIPSFQGGTGGRFMDFGAGTPAILHGRERIQTINESGGDGAGLVVLEKRLVSIERLLRDQPRAFGLAIADSMTLMN